MVEGEELVDCRHVLLVPVRKCPAQIFQPDRHRDYPVKHAIPISIREHDQGISLDRRASSNCRGTS